MSEQVKEYLEKVYQNEKHSDLSIQPYVTQTYSETSYIEPYEGGENYVNTTTDTIPYVTQTYSETSYIEPYEGGENYVNTTTDTIQYCYSY